MTIMANNKQKPLLDISTEKQDNYIQIDKEQITLTDFDSFSVLERKKILELGQSLKTTVGIENDEDEQAEHKVLNHLFGFIMPNARIDILNKLSVVKKQDILDVYLMASGLLKKNTETETEVQEVQ